MRKTLWLCAAFLLIFAPVRASAVSVEEAIEACRSEAGLLPDEPGGLYSSRMLVVEMRLRLNLRDREAFDELVRLMRKHFQSPLMLLYRQLDASLRPVACENSMAADLQVCRLLLEAAERWDVPAYKEQALKMARRILRFNVYRDVLIDGVSWKERRSGIFSIAEPSHTLDLSGVDVQALRLLQTEMPEWEPVAQRCLGILLAGSGAHSLRTHYNVEKKFYFGSEDEVTESLAIIANLVDGGLVPMHAMERLLRKQRENPRFLARGESASLAASALGGYVMARTGHVIQSQQMFTFLEEAFAGDGGLFAEPGKKPSVFDNLLCAAIRRALTPRKIAE